MCSSVAGHAQLLQELFHSVIHHPQRKYRIGEPLAPRQSDVADFREHVELFRVAGHDVSKHLAGEVGGRDADQG